MIRWPSLPGNCLNKEPMPSGDPTFRWNRFTSISLRGRDRAVAAARPYSGSTPKGGSPPASGSTC